ncbi:nitroreductase/quinone reductase family protein [Streptomyces sp. MS19]|uniref:nitroreductase/quinone reductase family protein n=1 Tax=Streptomyces sp. MS19 TaxID=3385972 RepID=UPI0039A07BD8
MDENEQWIVKEFRERLAAGMDAAALLLLTYAGARTGARRITPLMRLWLGGRLYVIASAAGAARHPAWFHTPPAHRAVVPAGRERDALFAEAVRARPCRADHQARRDRAIPVAGPRRADGR